MSKSLNKLCYKMLVTYSSMLRETVTTAPDLLSRVRESLWKAREEDKSPTLTGTSQEGMSQ
jgi:hypothetical protein